MFEKNTRGRVILVLSYFSFEVPTQGWVDLLPFSKAETLVEGHGGYSVLHGRQRTTKGMAATVLRGRQRTTKGWG